MEDASKSIVQNSRNDTKFENLPQHLIHHIINFLPYKEAAKFSVLSKTCHSIWVSFPVLHFNYEYFKRDKDPYHSFLFFILKTLQLRCPHNTDKSLQTLTVEHHESITDSLLFPTVFDVLLNFAMDYNTKEIIFDLPTKDVLISVRYDSLLRLFSSQFLTLLNLTGVMFSTAEANILCPQLKELLISFCEGLQTIKVSSLSLEKFNINFCSGLEGVQLNAKNLMNFVFIGLQKETHEPHRCHINVSDCESIKRMFLYDAEVSKQLMELVTHRLFITNCDLPENLSVHNPSIKVLDMKHNFKMKNLLLSAPKLERLGYFLSPEEQKCSVNISACVALKVLELEGAILTDECLTSTISDLPCLKELEISDCNELEKLELKNDKLEKLSLRKCSNLKEATIDAPNLLTFDYYGSLQVYRMQISSNKCNSVSIKLPKCNIDLQLWFGNIMQFLACFHHIKDLTITCFQAKDVTFPKEYVENNLSPLQDLKYVKVQMRCTPRNKTVMKLVKSLLWLAPKPMEFTFSILQNDKICSLKFEYGKEVKKKKVEEKGCCAGVPTKCWRHYELKVDTQGFNACVTKTLSCYFASYM